MKLPDELRAGARHLLLLDHYEQCRSDCDCMANLDEQCDVVLDYIEAQMEQVGYMWKGIGPFHSAADTHQWDHAKTMPHEECQPVYRFKEQG